MYRAWAFTGRGHSSLLPGHMRRPSAYGGCGSPGTAAALCILRLQQLRARLQRYELSRSWGQIPQSSPYSRSQVLSPNCSSNTATRERKEEVEGAEDEDRARDVVQWHKCLLGKHEVLS